MPESTPLPKRRAVEGYGGQIQLCAPTLEAREETAARMGHETGARFIHPYDQAEVIAGQGTLALELGPGQAALVKPLMGCVSAF